jgi:proline iminopeptidase
MRIPIVFIASAAATAAAASVTAAYRLVVGPWYRGWGVDPDTIDRALPGDDLIEQPTGVETREIVIDAPPHRIWPWLVQMGFGRAGWYSYDRLDMDGDSAIRIVPEWQSIAVGDVIPTHPGGGFRVESIEPDRSLVLYLDDTLVGQQSKVGDEPVPAGLAMSGAIMGTQPGAFRTSWAFALEPLEDGRTRLVERCRIWFASAPPMARLMRPFLGFGVFLMIRRQMLGLRERAELSSLAGGEPGETAPLPEVVAPQALAPA